MEKIGPKFHPTEKISRIAYRITYVRDDEHDDATRGFRGAEEKEEESVASMRRRAHRLLYSENSVVVVVRRRRRTTQTRRL